MAFQGCGNLDTIFSISRTGVRDRDNRYDLTAFYELLGRNDSAWAMFAAILETDPVFPCPEVGVADNETGTRIGQAHGVQSLRIASR